jgi:hypothetical protein
MQKFWFKRKLYGWGWYPASWQGWLITAVYVVVIVSASMTIDDNSPTREVVFTFILPVVICTILFIRIAYRTGEKPRWQWGADKSDGSEHSGPIDPE